MRLGATLGKIQKDAGGDDHARIIQMPPRDSTDTTIRVVGKKAVVENIISALQAFVQEREGRVTEILEVPSEKHRILIGHGGSVRRKLESDLKVSIDIPRQDTQGAARTQVKISGQPAEVQNAKEHIAKMIKEQEGETLHVPRRYHHHITDNGAIFRRLRDDHKVTVDHGGHKLPPRPAAANPRGRANGGANMPLITDEPSSSADNYSWEVVESGGEISAEEAAELIPWILRGSPENVARARQMIETALENAKKPSATGYLILPDPKTYRYVIGQGGSTINKMRKETGTKITVPKAGERGEAIEIVGSREGVEQAKDLILEAVERGGNDRRRS
jgi:predicted PilT family ATPase